MGDEDLPPKKQLPKREEPRARTVIPPTTTFHPRPKEVVIEYKRGDGRPTRNVADQLALCEHLASDAELARKRELPKIPYQKPKVDSYGAPFYQAWTPVSKDEATGRVEGGCPSEHRMVVLVQNYDYTDALSRLEAANGWTDFEYLHLKDLNAALLNKDHRYKEIPLELRFGAHALFVEDERLRGERLLAEMRRRAEAEAEAAATGKKVKTFRKPLPRKGAFHFVFRRGFADRAGYDRFIASLSANRAQRQWADRDI